MIALWIRFENFTLNCHLLLMVVTAYVFCIDHLVDGRSIYFWVLRSSSWSAAVCVGCSSRATHRRLSTEPYRAHKVVFLIWKILMYFFLYLLETPDPPNNVPLPADFSWLEKSALISHSVQILHYPGYFIVRHPNSSIIIVCKSFSLMYIWCCFGRSHFWLRSLISNRNTFLDYCNHR